MSAGPAKEAEPKTFQELAIRLLWRAGTAVLSSKTIISLSVVLLAWGLGSTALLPDDERSGQVAAVNGALGRVADKMLQTAWAKYTPWFAAFCVVAVAVLALAAANRRVQRQRGENSRLRNNENPQRISSRNPDSMENYLRSKKGEPDG